MTTATPARPVALPVLLDNVPPALRAVPRWVLWKFMLQTRADGRQVWAKVPWAVSGKRKASSTDPATWAPFDAVARAYTLNPTKVDGVGFIFDGSDDWVGVDLDDCVVPDPLGGAEPTINALAYEALRELPGYWEVSPSGTGIKGWVHATGVGSGANHSLGIEVYPAGRYFTVTGHALPCREPAEATSALKAWVQRNVGDVSPVVALAVLGPTTGDDALDAFMELEATSQPFPDWTIERVRDEIAPHLDVEAHYEEWSRVGMILHHQFDGADEALELWQDIYRGSSKFAEETGEAKWGSFGKRTLKGSVATIGTLLEWTKAARAKAAPAKAQQKAAAKAVSAADRMAEHRLTIDLTGDITALETLARNVLARDTTLNSVEHEVLARALQTHAATLSGVKPPIAAMRQWLSPVSGNAGMPRVLDGWVYLLNEDKFYNLNDFLEPISRQAFDMQFNQCLPPGSQFQSASDMFKNVWQGPCLRRRLYAPPEGPIFERFGASYANIYNPSSVPADCERVPADEAVLERHFAMLLPDARERRLLIGWLAHNVQKPGVLLGWAPYVCSSAHGAGKGALGHMLAAAMGPANVGSVPVKGLSDKFSGWATGRAVNILDEVKLHGENRHDVVNALKPYITERQVSVEPKGRDAFDVPNYTNYLLFSNYVDGLPVDEGDRRYGFFVSPMTKADVLAGLQSGHYAALFDDIFRHRPGSVRAWMLAHQVDPEVLAWRAPETAGRARVLEAVEPDSVTAGRQVIAEGAKGVTERTVVASVLARLVREKIGYRPQSNTLSSALEQLGFTRYSRAVKWQGRVETVWVRGWAPAGNEAVRTELDGSNDPSEFDCLL